MSEDLKKHIDETLLPTIAEMKTTAKMKELFTIKKSEGGNRTKDTFMSVGSVRVADVSNPNRFWTIRRDAASRKWFVSASEGNAIVIESDTRLDTYPLLAEFLEPYLDDLGERVFFVGETHTPKKKKSTNKFTDAKNNKKDEFYTQITDIEKELKHYRKHFKGKVVFCNCDDPKSSNFWTYFSLNFDKLGLKKLISTHYTEGKPSIKQVKNGGDPLNLDVQYFDLKEDGDFRSDECVEILKECDIVVTNPPFSLFREYLALLVEHGKQFLIIGNNNALSYKDVFTLIKDQQMWLGVNSNKTMAYRMPDSYELKGTAYIGEDGNKYAKVPAISWFTNLHHNKRSNDKLKLYETYEGNETKYPTYDNYDAINVDKVAQIPKDYDGAIGVPITFMSSYNPDQFEILGMTSGRDEFEAIPTKRYINAKQINKDGSIVNGSKANTRATLLSSKAPKGVYYTADNVDGYLTILYARFIIKHKRKQK